ncbi:MAG: 50S ribosome-binding GTPase [Methanomicrobiales archaeon]|nr:50S ribosome-binding GTPase [Methanomicrobiales archaeon]
MDFSRLKTVPTAEELMDRSLRRAAKKMRLKRNRKRADEEFIRAISSALHDRLVAIIQDLPEVDGLLPFYREMTEILIGRDRFKKSLGAVGWAAWQIRLIGSELARRARGAEDTGPVRRQAVARISSIVHQVNDALRFLNEARNQLRSLPDIREEFTVVVAGYPNVGKSSFIRRVSTAEPEVAEYPFTTKGIIMGHRKIGRESVQLIDTPGILSRPAEERNWIERQALAALLNVADIVLLILDPSETCGYTFDDQLRLKRELEGALQTPLVTVVNKADIKALEGYPNMSTSTGEGVEGVLSLLLRCRASPTSP